MSAEQIKAAVKKMAKEGGYDAPMDRGIVLDVDKNEATCTVQLVADDSILEGVKLKPVINDGDNKQLGIILFPAKNSFVIIGQIDRDNTDLFVVGMTVIESIALDTATAFKMLITADGKLNLNAVQMVFNDGKNGGIPLLKPLTDTIVALQLQVNNLIDSFNSHFHLGVQTGSGSTGAINNKGPAPTDPVLKPSDIENKEISQ